MSLASTKPIIFVSYSHKDEPEHPHDGEIQWLSFVQSFLQPAVKGGLFEVWVDRQMKGGADWDLEIETKLRSCDIFVLLVSTNSMASGYVIDKEIAIVRERQAGGELVHFYPLLLTPTPIAGLEKVRDKNLRPRDARPLSSFPSHDRQQHMSDVADEIAELAEHIGKQKSAAQPRTSAVQPPYVHVTGLPETGYERLVGRRVELERLDAVWADSGTNILSLVGEGGAGKSALVNEWLKRMRIEHYRGAEAVLGWSFYNQGTKERSSSADEFLNWALDKLSIRTKTISAAAKGEAIAEALTHRRVLLLLDGCEPLQHGLDSQLGELRDLGLRALLRHFASIAPTETHGLVVLTSRLAIKDIARWNDRAAPVLHLNQLSEEDGAALLRDNGVWGTDRDLRATARDFGGHPLALGLLASFLAETQFGDSRRRDHVRGLLADSENPRHDHAKRVMESYEREWLAALQVPHAIMNMVGLFDQPAGADCLAALRRKPVIAGLTDAVAEIDEDEWRRGVVRLRKVRMLAPLDPSAPDALDAHPLVREWFGQRLERASPNAWHEAHGRLYEHLRDTTREGKTPALDDLAPLYRAIPHGCRAGRHEDALKTIFLDRICRWKSYRQPEYYSIEKLGATGSDLMAMSWFFEDPYGMPIATLGTFEQSFVLGHAGFALRAQGRFAEALPALRMAMRLSSEANDWPNATNAAFNVSGAEVLVGEITAAVSTAEQGIAFANQSGNKYQMIVSRANIATALDSAGRREEAEHLFSQAEQQQKKLQPKSPLLYALHGYMYCDLLLAKREFEVARKRASQTLKVAESHNWLLHIALDTLTLARASLGMTLEHIAAQRSAAKARYDARTAYARLLQALDCLRSAGSLHHVPPGLFLHSILQRSVGDWDRAALDLDEVVDIAESGSMRLHLCDAALERARLAFARIAAFAPLNGILDDSPPKPQPINETQRKNLEDEAARQLDIAADCIKKCDYHKRDEEVAELQAVLRGEQTLAGLPPRV